MLLALSLYNCLKMCFLPTCCYKQGGTVEDGSPARQNQPKTNQKAHQTCARARDHHPGRRRQNRGTTHGLNRTCRHTWSQNLRADHQKHVFGKLIIKKSFLDNGSSKKVAITNVTVDTLNNVDSKSWKIKQLA